MKSWFKAVSVVTTVFLSVGCVETSTSSVGLVNTEPLVVDQAMQQRNWEPSYAYYANGDTPSWSVGFGYSPRSDLQPYQYYFADTGTYLLNLVTMPYTFYQQRGGLVSTGVQLPPTYTAVPPLPPPSTETAPN